MRISTVVAVPMIVVTLVTNVGAQSAGLPVPVGVWGGQGIQLTVREAGSTISYNCASGTITEPLLVNPAGRFVVRGTHTFGLGGPRLSGASSRRSHKATYEGVVDGHMMKLTVSLPDLGRTVGDFTLELGRRAALERCG
jgi:hypothetical protein